LSERDGLEGVVGEAGAGRAGDEYEREPRLPLPPLLPARAHASPASLTIARPIARPIRVIHVRDLMVCTSTS
jgi:hypothetical protein